MRYLIPLVLLLVWGCGNSSNKISVLTVHAKGPKETPVIDSSFTYLKEKYFEVNLYSYTSDPANMGYEAEKVLLRSPLHAEFEYKFLCIVDSDKKRIRFSSPTDFLNYMSSGGYAVKDQTKFEHRVEYLFEKKG